MANVFVAATVLTIAWGTFAFGAVYPWAYVPLAIACTVTGGLGLFLGRGSAALVRNRWLLVALQCICAVGLLQLVPLPRSVLTAISPATDRFLTSFNLGYAYSGLAAADQVVGGQWHPLSIDPSATLRALELFATFAIFLAGLLAALTRDLALRVARLLVSMGIVLALFGIVQKLLLGDHVFGGMRIYGFWTPRYMLTTPFGPFVNKNHFAGWMLMVLPLALGIVGNALEGLARRRTSVRLRVVWLSTPEGGRFLMTLFGVALMGLALVMTRSRSGIACVLLGALLTATLSGRAGLSRRSGVISAVWLVLLFGGGAIWAGLDNSFRRFATDSQPVQLRVHVWEDSWTIVRDFPVLGTGLNTFGTATTSYQTTQKDQHFQEAHNDYLQLLVEGGGVLAVAVLLAIAALAAAIAARLRSDQDDPESRWLRVCATIGLLLIAAQSTVEFSLQMPGNAALCTLLVALALHRPRHDPVSL